MSVRLVEAIISLETYRFMSRLTSLATNHWFIIGFFIFTQTDTWAGLTAYAKTI
jgi:hypothetical protein